MPLAERHHADDADHCQPRRDEIAVVVLRGDLRFRKVRRNLSGLRCALQRTTCQRIRERGIRLKHREPNIFQMLRRIHRAGDRGVCYAGVCIDRACRRRAVAVDRGNHGLHRGLNRTAIGRVRDAEIRRRVTVTADAYAALHCVALVGARAAGFDAHLLTARALLFDQRQYRVDQIHVRPAVRQRDFRRDALAPVPRPQHVERDRFAVIQHAEKLRIGEAIHAVNHAAAGVGFRSHQWRFIERPRHFGAVRIGRRFVADREHGYFFFNATIATAARITINSGSVPPLPPPVRLLAVLASPCANVLTGFGAAVAVPLPKFTAHPELSTVNGLNGVLVDTSGA
ncbi:hypothetical protein KCU90_g1170, partial [Aureobasidium melanogenum]